ncbi:hypothetical protein QR680_017920 [Steinernema hermaphroditum]|uniref:Uncharacterized protein n=1 Tax=Steinernema hermaphroditum TaxID=289476 RepID=A0AA39LPZ6_9BILA|nr:hypothetical protein QR680_017920 [Steinernema hermaphroditum]
MPRSFWTSRERSRRRLLWIGTLAVFLIVCLASLAVTLGVTLGTGGRSLQYAPSRFQQFLTIAVNVACPSEAKSSCFNNTRIVMSTVLLLWKERRSLGDLYVRWLPYGDENMKIEAGDYVFVRNSTVELAMSLRNLTAHSVLATPNQTCFLKHFNATKLNMRTERRIDPSTLHIENFMLVAPEVAAYGSEEKRVQDMEDSLQYMQHVSKTVQSIIVGIDIETKELSMYGNNSKHIGCDKRTVDNIVHSTKLYPHGILCDSDIHESIGKFSFDRLNITENNHHTTSSDHIFL